MSNIHLLERSLRKLRLTRVSAEWHTLDKRALAEGLNPVTLSADAVQRRTPMARERKAAAL